jgi:hypothetical protein
MKALTIRQPWASLIVAGLKDVENRSWPASYRGPLVIHAGLGMDAADVPLPDGLEMPRGVILGTAEVVDCVRGYRSAWALPGAWHWVLAAPRKLATPIPAKGRLGLWLPGEAATALIAELIRLPGGTPAHGVRLRQ